MLVPSYDSGKLLAATLAEALAHWAPVWVVIDGGTDRSGADAEAMARADNRLRVLRLARNQGKGAAIRHGLLAAAAAGFTHALLMDADGQHPTVLITTFMAVSHANPDTLVMGRPVFGPDAPRARVIGRRISNWLAAIEVGRPVGDTLFGFRVAPIAPLLAAFSQSTGMRRYDFDHEAVVRLAWAGTRLIHLAAPVRYLGRAEGGISHFRYIRDNARFLAMHLRLAASVLARRLASPFPPGGERHGEG